MDRQTKFVIWGWGIIIALIAFVIGAYQWSNHVPSRPKNVSSNAVYLRGPGLPTPHAPNGKWLSCRLRVDSQVYCSVYETHGNMEFSGKYVVVKGPAPSDKNLLRIDTEKSAMGGVPAGNTSAPVLFLQSGAVLIPESTTSYAKRSVLEELGLRPGAGTEVNPRP